MGGCLSLPKKQTQYETGPRHTYYNPLYENPPVRSQSQSVFNPMENAKNEIGKSAHFITGYSKVKYKKPKPNPEKFLTAAARELIAQKEYEAKNANLIAGPSMPVSDQDQLIQCAVDRAVQAENSRTVRL